MKLKIPKIKNSQSVLSAQGGYSLIELLFYVSFFAIFVLVTINAMIIMTRSFRETTHFSQLIQSGSMVERMVREIRQASGVTIISATSIRIDTLDDAGLAKTEEFTLSGSNLEFYENGISSGNLNSPNITLTALSFSGVTTARGSAVKVSLSIRSTDDSLSRVYNFYDTVVLRGNY